MSKSDTINYIQCKQRNNPVYFSWFDDKIQSCWVHDLKPKIYFTPLSAKLILMRLS